MTDLAWIAALLCPRDVAPHPNFRSDETLTAPSLFALHVTAQSARFLDERASEAARELLALDPIGMEVVDATQIAMQLGTAAEGAELLERLAVNGPQEQPCLRVACAVVASSCFAELDRVNDAVRVLEHSSEVAVSPNPDIAGLVRSILLVSIALRYRDAGGDAAASTRDASAELSDLVVDRLPAFELSKSTSWDTRQTFANIVAMLRDSCESHIAEADPNFNAWLELVRGKPTRMSLRRQARNGAALDKFLKKAFDEAVGAGARTWSIGGADGDDELVEALFIAEFSGSPSATYQRGLLGTLRFLEGRETNQDWLVREGIRLLRQGNHKGRLEPALRLIRDEGPLEVLQGEAMQILRNRTDPRQLGDLEAAVLTAGADVLGPQTATDGVRRLLRLRLEPLGVRAGRWQHPSSWYETAVRAAARLSPAAGLEEDVFLTVLGDLEDERVTAAYDHVVGRVLAGFGQVTWQSERVQSAVRGWLQKSAESFADTRSALSRQLALSAPQAEVVPVLEPLTLISLAQAVDRSIVAGAEFPLEILSDAKSIVSREMQTTRVAAASGQFAGKSVSECDVAVALEFLAGDLELWPAIVEFVCDPQVQRDDKTGALKRIVRSPDKVPVIARDMLRDRAQQLISGGPTFLGPAIDPYPSALAVCALLELLPTARILSLTGSLLGSQTTHVRTEGVQIISAMVSHGMPQPWLATSTFLSSYDEDASVRFGCLHPVLAAGLL
jgi:hypothetical protein